MHSRIAGTGHYAPEKILTNADLEKMVDTTDEWIRARSGIERRHIAADDETTTDLAEPAARAAIEAAGVGPEDIDFLVVGTTTPDLVFPNVGCLLQERLGIHGSAAFSIEAACSGFIYALSVADKFIVTGQSKCALVIGAETLSRIVDWSDRSTCVLFGDGAGAVVLKPDTEPGIISTHLRADGRYKDLLTVEDAFRTVKSILDVRPIYHKCDDTIRGHVFCSFLALVMLKELQNRMQSRGCQAEWQRPGRRAVGAGAPAGLAPPAPRCG